MRRFIWHDRIHAKAMWRMAKRTFPECEIENVFYFKMIVSVMKNETKRYIKFI